VIARRWSAQHALVLVLVVILWIGSGFGVYLALASQRSSLTSKATRPEDRAASGPLQHLPGTVYIVQDGTLYRLQNGIFTPILKGSSAASWTMPAVSPNGQSLVVVQRDYAYSDLYLIDSSGHVQSQLTHDANRTLQLNHWAMYPRLSATGTTLWFSYDPKDVYNNYNVVMAVWSVPLGAPITQMRKWTIPHDYTGGDVEPVPLPDGAGLVYTKYALETTQNRIMGQIWVTNKAGTAGHALTAPDEDCSEPALSPDGRNLAMICTAGGQTASIQVAGFDGSNLGPRLMVSSGALTAQPTWSPDGRSIVYLQAQGITGHFQLWQQVIPALPQPTPVPTPTPRPRPTPRGAVAPSPSPSAVATPAPTPIPLVAPVQLTTNLDFDATSTIAWHA
jgi:hypothetical protein